MASITTDHVRFNNTFLDESFEHACEIESQLPEYLPDIKQVVRVDARPLITEVKADNGILEAKGRVDIIVLYMPEEGSLQSHHCRIPFSTGLSGKTCPENARYTGKVRMDSVTCRPLSGRKVELRCVVDMTLQGESAEVAEIVAPTANEIQQLECLNRERIVALCIDRVRDEFSVEEMIELPENSPRMERIVKCDVDAFIGDRRVTGGKAILSGELCVNCLYICDIDSGNMEQFATEIPFNRVVEVSGLQEGDEVGVQLNVMDTAFGILEDTAGEDRILSLKVGVAGQVSAYRNQQVNTVSDAYGKNLHCNIRHQDWAVEQVLGIDGCHVKIGESFTPAEPIAGIYSAEAYADVKRVTLEDNKLRFQGDLLVSFLVRKENGDCAGLDQLFPFETACEQVGAGFEGGAFLGDCRLTEFSYQVGIGASITVEAKLSCRAVARVRKTYSTAASIEVEPAGGNAPQRCLTLYYPVEGESLWEIGKRYTTPIREIVNVNMLESEEIPSNLKMLLIPR